MEVYPNRYHYLIHRDNLPKLIQYGFVTQKRLATILTELEQKGHEKKAYSLLKAIPSPFFKEENCFPEDPELTRSLNNLWRKLRPYLDKTKHPNYYRLDFADLLTEVIIRELDLVPAKGYYMFCFGLTVFDLAGTIATLETIFSCKIAIEDVIKKLRRRQSYRLSIDQNIDLCLEIYIHSAVERMYVPSFTLDFEGGMIRIKKRPGAADAEMPGFKILIAPKEKQEYFFGDVLIRTDTYARHIEEAFQT